MGGIALAQQQPTHRDGRGVPPAFFAVLQKPGTIILSSVIRDAANAGVAHADEYVRGVLGNGFTILPHVERLPEWLPKVIMAPSK
jgi:hypothetical protein